MQTVDGRIPPALPAAAYKTFQIAAPLKTHWNTLTCAEAQCDAYLHGWVTAVDESTELGQRQAHYIRRESGRRFTEERDEAGLTVFSFEPGQNGFASRVAEEDHRRHRARNMRPERFVERGGDHRGNPVGDFREHTDPEFWVESFAENQDRILRVVKRG